MHDIRRSVPVPLAALLAAVVVALAAGPVPAEKADEAAGKEAKPSPVAHPEPREAMEKVAREDPLQLLYESYKWYRHAVKNYTCEFYKQELIDGELKKAETTRMKFREDPFSVYLKWVGKQHKSREAIYVSGKYKNKAVVHPAPPAGWVFRKVEIDPAGEQALKNSRRPVTVAGIGNMLKVVIPQIQEGRANGDMTLTYEGIRPHDDRDAYLVKRVFPKGKGYPCFQLFLYVDVEYLLPVRAEAYNWNGQLISDYRYSDLEFNTDLDDEDFDPANPDYEFTIF